MTQPMPTRVSALNRGALPWLLLIGMSVLWLTRQPGTTSFTTIYIDDAIFLNQAVFGDWSMITQPHNGYLHLIPRTIALIAAAAPLQWAAVVFAIGCVVVLFAGMLVTWTSLREQPGFVGRYALLIALTLAIIPVASIETVANIACLQWYLVSVAIAVTALGGTQVWRGWALAVFLLLTALSTPLVVLAVPGAIWLAIRSRRGGAPALQSWLPFAGLALGLIPQLTSLTSSPGFDDTEQVDVISRTTAETVLEMVGPLPLLGWDLNRGIPYGLPAAAVIALSVLGFIAVLLWWARQPITEARSSRMRVAIVLSVLAVIAALGIVLTVNEDLLTRLAQLLVVFGCIAIVLAAGVFLTTKDTAATSEQVIRGFLLAVPAVAIVIASVVIRPSVRTLSLGNPGGTRYVLPLGFVMWILVVLALVVLLVHAMRRPRTWFIAAPLLVITIGVVASSWSDSLGRGTAPTWRESLTQACLGVEPGTPVSVPTAPRPWITSVPCPASD